MPGEELLSVPALHSRNFPVERIIIDSNQLAIILALERTKKEHSAA
jgi:hypothetical protein